MEKQKKDKDVSEEFIQRIKDSIEESKKGVVPQEAHSNSMAIQPFIFKIGFRPNNYRRQMQVQIKDNSTIQKIKSAIGVIPAKRNQLIFIKNYKGFKNIILQYGKTTLTAIYSQEKIKGEKMVYGITSDDPQAIISWIMDKVKEIQEAMDNCLLEFAKQFKIKLPYNTIRWNRYEDALKGIDFLDNIPSDSILYTSVGKKVYDDGFEYTQTNQREQPGLHIAQTIENYAIKKVSPEISKELNTLKEIIKGCLEMNNATSKTINNFMNEFLPVHKEHAINIKTHTAVLKRVDQSFNKFNKLLDNNNLYNPINNNPQQEKVNKRNKRLTLKDKRKLSNLMSKLIT